MFRTWPEYKKLCANLSKKSDAELKAYANNCPQHILIDLINVFNDRKACLSDSKGMLACKKVVTDILPNLNDEQVAKLLMDVSNELLSAQPFIRTQMPPSSRILEDYPLSESQMQTIQCESSEYRNYYEEYKKLEQWIPLFEQARKIENVTATNPKHDI